jgi:hypothetical protein
MPGTGGLCRIRGRINGCEHEDTKEIRKALYDPKNG